MRSSGASTNPPLPPGEGRGEGSAAAISLGRFCSFSREKQGLSGSGSSQERVRNVLGSRKFRSGSDQDCVLRQYVSSPSLTSPFFALAYEIINWYHITTSLYIYYMMGRVCENRKNPGGLWQLLAGTGVKEFSRGEPVPVLRRSDIGAKALPARCCVWFWPADMRQIAIKHCRLRSGPRNRLEGRHCLHCMRHRMVEEGRKRQGHRRLLPDSVLAGTGGTSYNCPGQQTRGFARIWVMATGTQDELSSFHEFLSQKLRCSPAGFRRKKCWTCGGPSILPPMTIPATLRREGSIGGHGGRRPRHAAGTLRPHVPPAAFNSARSMMYHVVRGSCGYEAPARPQ